MGSRNWGVYLVTDRKQTGGRDLVGVVAQALAGGVRAIQLREKDLATIEVFRLAERLLALAREAGAALIVNDRVDVAMALGADGVHLTRKSLPPKDARALVGPRMRLGISCHNLADVREAVEGGVDFLVLGPIYETPSKAPYGAPLTPAILRQARDICDLPILAIGGIIATRVPEVIRSGADGVAVISAVLAAPDPAAATRDLLAAVSRSRAIGKPDDKETRETE
ncbi:MAG: thiamine phosphate synthase [Zetaproteobacteria bacterium]|nr:MAG: thiamine phosphate synthase [Zetaproteobacteria bacterium]